MPTEKKTAFGFKKQGHSMWIGMIVFFSIWMFVLGVFVGRGTAPVTFDIEKLQKELIALKDSVLDEQKEQFETYMETAQQKTNLGFYEALKAPDGAEQPERVVTRKKASAEKPLARVKRESPTRPSEGEAKNLTIQISSLKDLAGADAMVAKLKQQGYAAYRTTGNIPGKGVWYRVRVGYYSNKAEAEVVIQKLSQDKYEPYLVKWQ
jgi:cell division septation protein DedD